MERSLPTSLPPLASSLLPPHLLKYILLLTPGIKKNILLPAGVQEIAACSLQPFSSSGDFYTAEDSRCGQGPAAGRDPSQPAWDGTPAAGPASRCWRWGPGGSQGVPSAVGTGGRLAGACSSGDKAAVEPSPSCFENPSCTRAAYPAFDFWGFPQCSDPSFWACTPTASAGAFPLHWPDQAETTPALPRSEPPADTLRVSRSPWGYQRVRSIFPGCPCSRG